MVPLADTLGIHFRVPLRAPVRILGCGGRRFRLEASGLYTGSGF